MNIVAQFSVADLFSDDYSHCSKPHKSLLLFEGFFKKNVVTHGKSIKTF